LKNKAVSKDSFSIIGKKKKLVIFRSIPACLGFCGRLVESVHSSYWTS